MNEYKNIESIFVYCSRCGNPRELNTEANDLRLVTFSENGKIYTYIICPDCILGLLNEGHKILNTMMVMPSFIICDKKDKSNESHVIWNNPTVHNK